jgi:ribosomal protein S7
MVVESIVEKLLNKILRGKNPQGKKNIAGKNRGKKPAL